MTVYVELELTAYLLSVDDCRHVVISFIEQCQYSLVNIVVYKDNTFLCTLNQVGHESIGIINLPIVEHTLFRLCIALVQFCETPRLCACLFLADVAAFPVDGIP